MFAMIIHIMNNKRVALSAFLIAHQTPIFLRMKVDVLYRNPDLDTDTIFRNFSLELKRIVQPNIILQHKKTTTKPDMSFIYTGKLTGWF